MEDFTKIREAENKEFRTSNEIKLKVLNERVLDRDLLAAEIDKLHNDVLRG